MLAYIARRILLSALTVSVMSLLAFVVIQLPEGDYVTRKIQEYERAGDQLSIQLAKNMRDYYGVDRPMIVQYSTWVFRMVTKLEFGSSFDRPGDTINEIIGERLAYTIALTGFTIAVTWLMGLPIGIYSAMRPHTVGDYVFTFVGFTGLAVPDFLLGLVMMYVLFAFFDMSVGGLFSGKYQLAPWSIGKVFDMLQHLIIPAVVLGTSGTAGLIRVMRNNLLDEMGRPYVVTARAKGMVNWKLIVKYPVRVAINPFISSIGSLLPALIGGSVIVSIVLSLPTLGPVLLSAVMSQDMFLAGTITLLLGVLTVIGILISDIMLVVVDPRIKLYRQG